LNGNLELFWSRVLSEDPAQIIKAVKSLSLEEQQAVIEHLQRMANETGWLEEQLRRARIALIVLDKETK